MKKKYRLTNYQPLHTELDIAMIHAAPLAMSLDENIFPIEDSSLDFEAERRSLIEYLENKDVGADIRFEAATTDNLSDILEYKPKILYFSGQCYMKYDNVSEFVLAFEQNVETIDEKVEIGLIDNVNVERLKKILNNAPQYFQVVIVKGGLSREIGTLFLNAGFSCVVAIQDHKGEPKSRKFIAEFCRNLLIGDSIDTAFKKTEINADDDSIDIHCCCAHKHKPNCLWAKKLKLSNALKRHTEHVSENCCRVKGGIHKITCL